MMFHAIGVIAFGHIVSQAVAASTHLHLTAAHRGAAPAIWLFVGLSRLYTAGPSGVRA
jgi:hypothetical protein